MLPIEPEPIDKLKERFSAAMDPVYLATLVKAGHLPRPGTQRKHVFDFESGFRMIASVERERFDSDVVLHLSFSAVKIPTNITNTPDLIGYCHELAKEVTGGKFVVGQVHTTASVVHIVYNVNDLFTFSPCAKKSKERPEPRPSAWTSPLHPRQ